MKFSITATSVYGNDPERLLKEYPCLRDYNFEIKDIQVPHRTIIKDENGNPIVFKNGTYSVRHETYIDVDDLQTLLKLFGDTRELIITKSIADDADFEIEIYDDYRE